MDTFFYQVPLTGASISQETTFFFIIGLAMSLPYLRWRDSALCCLLIVVGGALMVFAGLNAVSSLVISPQSESLLGPGLDTTKVVSERYGARDLQKAACPADSNEWSTCFTYTASGGSREFVRVASDWDEKRAGYDVTVEHLDTRPPQATPSSKGTSS